MKSFVLINVLAGLAHYLFQVVAAKQLDAASFSTFSAWLAYLAFSFTLASVLHYFSCFLPLSRSRLRWLITLGAVPVMIIGLVPWLAGHDPIVLAFAASCMACLFAFLSGQAQARLQFTAMGTAGGLAGLAKLAMVLIPGWMVLSVAHFSLAIVYSYVPGLLLLATVLLRNDHHVASPTIPRTFSMALASTMILSSANAFIPQFELLLMKETQTVVAFEHFARLSLFYKAIFFGFMIIGQWLLPYQLRGESSKTKSLGDVKMPLVASSLAAAAAWIGPSFARHLLGWSDPPGSSLIFLSCLNMSCLTWLFLLLQDMCAKQKLKLAAIIWFGVFVAVPTQLALKLSVTQYYVFAIGLNLVLIAVAITCSDAKSPKPSSLSNAA